MNNYKERGALGLLTAEKMLLMKNVWKIWKSAEPTLETCMNGLEKCMNLGKIPDFSLLTFIGACQGPA
jgi:hypothetical protein